MREERRRAGLLAAGLFVCIAGSQAAGCAQEPPKDLVVRAGRLIDGTGAPTQEGVRVIVQSGTITAIEPDSEPFTPPADAAVLDARRLTVMPGMVDSHTHVLAVGAGPFQGLRNLHALLAGGVTTAADLGAPAWLAVTLRRHVGTARHRGPRLLVAGPLLTAPGGYPFDMGASESDSTEIARAVSGVEEARRAVRELARLDVDLVKVAVQEKSFNGRQLPMLAEESLCAVVEEAHRQELFVLAHAVTSAGYRAALACGVDGLGHSSLEALDDELLAQTVKARVPVAPTLVVFDAQGVVAATANTRALYAAGVPLALGTDGSLCFNILGLPVEELLRMQAAGLTPLELLQVATSGGARMLGLHDALGRLRVGYRADLLAVEGRPDQNLRDVANVRHVVIDGVEQELGPPPLTERAAFLLRLGWAWLRS